MTMPSNPRSLRILATVSLILLSVHGIERVSAAEASLGGYTVVPMPPPVEDGSAIVLSGKSENPLPETWSDIQGPEEATWFTGKRFVRNVAQPSITPFLPEPARATGAAMIVAPGGGTVVLQMEREGYSVARWLNQRGVAASQKQAATEEAATLQDGLEAIRYVRTHASQWHLSRDRIGIVGFSAGAYTSLGVALRSNGESRPNLVASIYGSLPGGLTVTASAPAVFIVGATDDPQVPAAESVRTYMSWRLANAPAELHLFQKGGHGFGAEATGTSTDQWLPLFDRWLRDNGFGKPNE
jgi:acetyl esterase/lipase